MSAIDPTLDLQVITGDCIDVMAEMEPGSVDAVVTDPPYGLGFMGKHWDRGVPGPAFWYQAFEVLKPGAHLLAFGGTRTFHRLAVAIEDAGFEIRDCLSWMYGSGFPKSLDVGKAIDKAAGAAWEVVGSKLGRPGYSMAPSKGGNVYEGGLGGTGDPAAECAITAPATVEAAAWEGWGTALKPAWEPIIMARKPLAGTVAANVQEHGTGAINVGDCRIGVTKDVPASCKRGGQFDSGGWDGSGVDGASGMDPKIGRWPANVCLDEHAAAMLDEQSGERAAGGSVTGNEPSKPFKNTYGNMDGRRQWKPHADTGGASRFFYCAKASRAERGEGNNHPTVKPVSLMRWLVRLVTPPGGVVIDMFAGSGSTGVAAMEEGFRFVGIELDPGYADIARARIDAATRQQRFDFASTPTPKPKQTEIDL